MIKDSGYLYCLYDAHNEISRIGQTYSMPSNRITQQKGYYPYELRLTAVQVEDRLFCERYMHKQFKNLKLNGDWFSINTVDFSTMMEICIVAERENREKKDEWTKRMTT